MQLEIEISSPTLPFREVISQKNTAPILRTFQTVLTDIELANHNIAVTGPSDGFIVQKMLDNTVQWSPSTSILYSLSGHPWADSTLSLSSSKMTTVRDGYFYRRLDELKEIAADEDVPLSTQSREGAEQFLASLPWAKLPSVFLVGNGNFRLVWDMGEERVGLQFLSNGRVQFVILQSTDGELSHVMGTKSVAQMHQLIDQLGLRAILCP